MFPKSSDFKDRDSDLLSEKDELLKEEAQRGQRGNRGLLKKEITISEGR